MDRQLKLWYAQSASEWTEALPIGNGRIGAMIFGRPEQELISLNEDTLWSGYPRDTNVAGANEYYRESQRLIAEGKYSEAQRFIEDTMLGPFTQSYMPLGDLLLDFGPLGEIGDYRRELSLDNALATTSFSAGGVRYTREAFASHPAQAMFIRLTADKVGALSCKLTFACQLRHEVCAENDRIHLRGIAPSRVQPNYVRDSNPVIYEEDDSKKGMRFAATASVEAQGGKTYAQDGAIYIQGADEVILRFAARTSFNGSDKQPYTEGRDEQADCLRDVQTAQAIPYEQAKRAHIEDYTALWSRVTLDLKDEKYIHEPTDERLRKFESRGDDRALCELIFHYGRYLIISASRPGTQPTNLQGIWNKELRAPWSSNYTININTQMNYWPLEICNLSELHEPLFTLIQGLMQTGEHTAMIHYGARGFVSHHNSDLWRLSNPVGNKGRGSAGYAFWPMSFGWLCEHLYEHYEYTHDLDFLRETALPALRGAARFYLDVMVDVNGKGLAISPATSPENAFVINGKHQNVAKAATMSNSIVREVFENYLSALEALKMDEYMAEEVSLALSKIYPFEIGSKGQLLEWDEEYEEAEPHHRHTSHLYPLHPAHQITPDDTPELAEACRQTLRLRGDDGTGWSLGWKINMWARLHDGDHALKLLKRQLRFVESRNEINYMGGGGTYMNLFDAHPPFQIDGNYGTTAGIAELFVQSCHDKVLLLPALPSEWLDCEVKGLRGINGLSIGLSVKNGELSAATVSSDTGIPTKLIYRGKTIMLDIAKGETVEFMVQDGALQSAI